MINREVFMTDHDHCAACGFDGSRYTDAQLLAELRGLGPIWADLLDDAGGFLRVRPAPEVWSAMEYAVHSRGVFGFHAFGVEAALTGEEPDFGHIENELLESATASAEDLAADPAVVAAGLGEQATLLADLAEAGGAHNWHLGLTVEGNRSEVRWLLEHALHDSVHHLDDVRRGLTRLQAETR